MSSVPPRIKTSLAERCEIRVNSSDFHDSSTWEKVFFCFYLNKMQLFFLIQYLKRSNCLRISCQLLIEKEAKALLKEAKQAFGKTYQWHKVAKISLQKRIRARFHLERWRESSLFVLLIFWILLALKPGKKLKNIWNKQRILQETFVVETRLKTKGKSLTPLSWAWFPMLLPPTLAPTLLRWWGRFEKRPIPTAVQCSCEDLPLSPGSQR